MTKGSSTKIGYAAQGNDGAIASTGFTNFAKVTEVGGVSIEADDIETSHMESANQFKEFSAGWADAGEVEFTIQFDKTNAETVYGLFRQDKSFQVLLKDTSAFRANGYVKKWGLSVEREGIVTVPMTIKISGEPEFEAAN